MQTPSFWDAVCLVWLAIVTTALVVSGNLT